MSSFIKGYKYRFYPDQDQSEYLAKVFGHSRFVYNHYLGKHKAEYEIYKDEVEIYRPSTEYFTNPLPPPPKPSANYYDFSADLTQLKRDPAFDWLNEVPDTCLRKSLAHLGDSFNRFFKVGLNSGYPKFKKKNISQDSATFSQDAFKINGNQFSIAKCKKPFKLKLSRQLPSIPKTATITHNSANEYYVSFTCEYIPEPTNGQTILGVDLGVRKLAALSTGEEIANPKYYEKSQKRLARLQRKLARQVKDSNSRKRTKLRIAKLHRHIANQRQDYLHKLSTRLVDDSQAICLEDLNVAGMVKNHKLAKSIITAGWSMFRTMLEYKTRASQWCRLLIADRFFPSTQLCSACNTKPSIKIKLGVTEWTCEHCHITHGRDINAAINLREYAIRNSIMWLDRPGSITLLARCDLAMDYVAA